MPARPAQPAAEALTVTLTPVAGDPRPAAARWRLGLKLLLRVCGLRASWPAPPPPPPGHREHRG